MPRQEFTGVTFNDLDPSGTRISRSPEFSVVSRNRAKYTTQSAYFYPTATTWRSGICYRKFVCLSSACLSLTFVRPTQGVEAFGNNSLPLCTLAILWPPCKVLWRSSQGNSSAGGDKRKWGSKIERWWTYRKLHVYLINDTR